MENIKFSCIVPMYNIQDYIEKCVTSILEQTYKNFEVIVVDDGSTDNSYEIVKKYESDKLKIVQKQNGGLSSARNEGMKYITGDYVWFIDGDDYIENNALELLYNKILEKEYDVICFSHICDYGDKKIKIYDKYSWEKTNELTLLCNSAWSKIYKKDFYTKHNFKFLEGKIYEDLALIPFIMVKAENIGGIEEHIYNYVQRNGSIMNSGKTFKTNRDDKFDALEKLYSLFKEDELYNKHFDELEFLAIRHLILVYSSEILPFDKDIYKPRAERVLKFLGNLNKNWTKNIYLKKSSILTKVYVWLFRNKFYKFCKLALKIKGI